MKLRYVPLVLCAMAVAPAGCYKYTPIETPQRGMEVRAQLETEAAVRRSEGLDDPVTRYDGVIVDLTAESVVLDVLVARSTSAFQDVEIRDTVRLQTTEVRALTKRTLAPVQTGLFTVLAGAAAFALVKGIDSVVGGTGDDDDGDGTPTFRIMVFSLTGSGLVPAILRGGARE